MKTVHRHLLPVDDRQHELYHTGPILATAHRTIDTIEFWAENTDDNDTHIYQVFGTGHPIPQDAQWRATLPRNSHGLVWHIYEIR